MRLLKCTPHSIVAQDWWNRDKVEVWTTAEKAAALDKKIFAKHVAKGLRVDFQCKRIKFYNRDLWTGKEEATADASLLDLCHGILKPAFIRWVLLHKGASRGKQLRQAALRRGVRLWVLAQGVESNAVPPSNVAQRRASIGLSA